MITIFNWTMKAIVIIGMVTIFLFTYTLLKIVNAESVDNSCNPNPEQEYLNINREIVKEVKDE